MPAAGLGQLGDQALARKTGPEQVLFGRRYIPAGEIHVTPFLIHGLDAAARACSFSHRPFAGSQLPDQFPILCVKINVAKAAAFRSPGEMAAVVKKSQVAVQVNPGFRSFGQHRLLLVRHRVDENQVQAFLVTALFLHRQGAVGREIHPRQVDVLVFAEIDLLQLSACKLQHE